MAIRKVTVHYINMEPTVEVLLQVSARLVPNEVERESGQGYGGDGDPIS